MAYKFHFLPQHSDSLTISTLQDRFRSIGFRIDPERPIASRGDLKGMVVFAEDEERGVHASVLLGAPALGCLGDEVTSLVELLAWVAKHTGTTLVVHGEVVDPDDPQSCLACAKRIINVHLARISRSGGGTLWTARDNPEQV